MVLPIFLLLALLALPTPSVATVEVIPHSPLDAKSVSKQCTAPICTELMRLIQGAGESVDFAVYGWRGQPALLDELAAAQARGVRVRGVIDKDIKGGNIYRDTPELERRLRHVRSDRRVDLETKEKLEKETKSGSRPLRDKCLRPEGHEGPLQCFEGGAYASREPIRFSGALMHNKFFIIDGRYVWTGSANVSDSGVGGYNANVVALIDSRKVAAAYADEFERMFTHGLFHREKERGADSVVEVKGEIVSVLFSPQDAAMDEGILPLIHNARQSINIAMFFLTHNEAARELAKASRRGVRVRIILDATGALNEYSKHDYLRNEGVEVKVESWGGKMHAKSAVIDGETVVVGSMNWTKAGATRNDENTLIIHSRKAARRMERFFDTLWASIPERWLRADPLPESRDSGTACGDGIDNDWDRRADRADPDCA